MTLNSRNALCCRKDASCEAHCTNFNEDRPVLAATKCRPMTLVSGNIRCMLIFAGVHLGRSLKWEWGCRRRQFLANWVATSSETSEVSRVFWIFLPNFIKMDLYNFELYRFKVGAFFETQWENVTNGELTCSFSFSNVTGRTLLNIRPGRWWPRLLDIYTSRRASVDASL